MPKYKLTRILVERNDSKRNRKFKVYSSLMSFIEKHSVFNYDTIKYHINRKKQPFKGGGIILSRVPYIPRKKKKKKK